MRILFFDFTVSDDIMERVLRAGHRMQAIWWISSKEYFVLADPLVCLSIPQENLLSPLAEKRAPPRITKFISRGKLHFGSQNATNIKITLSLPSNTFRNYKLTLESPSHHVFVFVFVFDLSADDVLENVNFLCISRS